MFYKIKFSAKKEFFLILFCLNFLLLISITFNKSIYSSEKRRILSISFSNSSISSRTNILINETMYLSTDTQKNGISGFDVCFSYNPSFVKFISIEDPKDENGSVSKFTKLKNTINNEIGEACIAYVAILPDSQLPKKVSQSFALKGISAKEGAITIKKAQAVGNIPGNEYQIESSVIKYSFTGENTTQNQANEKSNQIENLIAKIIAIAKNALGIK